MLVKVFRSQVRVFVLSVLYYLYLRRFLGYLRSTGDLDARNAILETVRPQAGDVLVANLHLAALEVHGLVQADLVVLGVLQGS